MRLDARPPSSHRLETVPVRRRGSRRSLAAVAAGTVLALAATLGLASTAWAGVALSIPPDVPTNVTVGTTVATQLTITHKNTSGEASLNDTLDQITLVPS